MGGSNAARDACDDPLDVDATMTAWSHWSACTETCNEGDAYRTRDEILPACHNGFPTGVTRQSKVCIEKPCECEKVICKYESHTCTNYQVGHDNTVENGVQYYRGNGAADVVHVLEVSTSNPYSSAYSGSQTGVQNAVTGMATGTLISATPLPHGQR